MMSSVADVVTIVAFLITCFTAWKVFFINRDVQNMSNRYLLKLRLPEQLGNLKEIADALVEHFRVAEDNIDKIRHLVVKTHVICDNLTNKVQGQKNIQLLALNDVLQICQVIRNKRNMPDTIRHAPDKPMLSSDDVIDLYSDLMLLIQSIEEVLKDMKEVVA